MRPRCRPYAGTLVESFDQPLSTAWWFDQDQDFYNNWEIDPTESADGIGGSLRTEVYTDPDNYTYSTAYYVINIGEPSDITVDYRQAHLDETIDAAGRLRGSL